MQPITAAAAALLASLSLTGCFLDSSGSGEGSAARPLSAEPDFVGSYTLEGNRILMATAGQTFSYCDGAERREVVQPGRVDTLEFALAGNRLTVLNAPETEAARTGGPLARIQWEASRSGRGTGLEGRWRIHDFDYRVVAGALDASAAAAWEKRIQAIRRGNALGISEMELRAGRAYTRSDIRWSELFLAEWNGELETALPSPASDRDLHDIKVVAVDKLTAELRGRKTGEAVRITFAADGTRSYSSDAQAHAPYADSAEPASCPDQAGWFEAFKSENARDA